MGRSYIQNVKFDGGRSLTIVTPNSMLCKITYGSFGLQALNVLVAGVEVNADKQCTGGDAECSKHFGSGCFGHDWKCNNISYCHKADNVEVMQQYYPSKYDNPKSIELYPVGIMVNKHVREKERRQTSLQVVPQQTIKGKLGTASWRLRGLIEALKGN